MSETMDGPAAQRLEDYLGRIGACLRDKRKRESFALYALGLLTETERKSVEPLAARLCGDPSQARAVHDKLLHFVGQADWDDRAVRRLAAREAIAALEQHDPVNVWIIDDTGFLKQGNHSPGVQRQYTGSAGKITNCQVAVSLVVANSHAQLPIDFELYLPQCWTEDAERRKEAKIPESVSFRTKIELGLEMIERAARDGLPGEIVLADCDYGKSPLFRETIRLHGLDYGVAVAGSTSLWCVDDRGRRVAGALTADELGRRRMHGGFRRIQWREGTKGQMSSRYCVQRVVVGQDDGAEPTQREPVWLLIEWLDSEPLPTKFLLTSLPRKMGLAQIVHVLRERWRTEQAYQEMKGELGLDHFEGRLFRGWHHHVSVVLCCYAFIVAERARHFSPSALSPTSPGPLRRAA